MRLIRTTLASATAKTIPIDPHINSFQISAALYGDTSINATAQVDATISDLGNKIGVTISRSTTTVTVTFPSTNPHYLGGTKDYIIIEGTGISSIDGTWPIASVSSATVVTFTSSASGTLAATNARAVPLKASLAFIASAAVSATNYPATVAVSATAVNLNAAPFSALLLNCTSYTAGTIILDLRESGM